MLTGAPVGERVVLIVGDRPRRAAARRRLPGVARRVGAGRLPGPAARAAGRQVQHRRLRGAAVRGRRRVHPDAAARAHRARCGAHRRRLRRHADRRTPPTPSCSPAAACRAPSCTRRSRGASTSCTSWATPGRRAGSRSRRGRPGSSGERCERGQRLGAAVAELEQADVVRVDRRAQERLRLVRQRLGLRHVVVGQREAAPGDRVSTRRRAAARRAAPARRRLDLGQPRSRPGDAAAAPVT